MKINVFISIIFAAMIAGCSANSSDPNNMSNEEKEKLAQEMIAANGGPKPDERSKEYFKTHIDEANEVRANCLVGTVSGAACENAEAAVIESLKK
jgi:hypothetical protein